MKKIIIIGGGLTGVSTAYFLEKHNIPYTLIEKENNLGGLCNTISIDGYKFDYTGHLLHLKTEKTKKFIFDELKLKNKFIKLERHSKVYIANRFIDYPFQSHIYQLPGNIRRKCIEKFKNRNQDNEPVTFKDWVKKYFGDGMGIYFFYPYNEKLWQMKCEKLSYDWTGRYLPRVKMSDILNPPKQMGYNSYFYYPYNRGIDILPKTIKNFLNPHNIIKGEKVISIDQKNNIIKTKNDSFKYNILINTAPLNKFLDISSVRNNLRANSVLNINIGFGGDNMSDVHWIYFPERQFPFYRVGFYSNFNEYMAPPGKNSIYVEISYYGLMKISNGIIDKKELENYKFLHSIINRLIKTGIIQGEIDLIHINKIVTAYVVYDFYRKNNIERFLKFLEDKNIYSIGRYGGWMYNSMEDNILQAWKTVETIKAKL